jgi:hypothetical protein
MWVHDDEARALAKHAERTERYMMWYWKPEHMKLRSKREDPRKWALIKVGKTEKLVFVDRNTKKAYKVFNNKATWMEIKSFTFIRWARPMDL